MGFVDLLKKPEYFEVLLESLEQPVIYVSDGLIQGVNSIARMLFRLNKENYLNISFRQFCKSMSYKTSQLLDANRNISEELEETYLIEEKKYYIAWKIIVLSKEKKKYLIIGVDHSGEKAISQSLEKVKFVQENILAKLPINVYWKDKSSTYLGCSDRLAKALGLSSREAIKGMSEYDIDWGVKGAIERHLTADKEVISTGNDISTEDSFKETSGRVVTLLTKKTPLLNQNNKIVGVLGISLDITDRKELEKKLEEIKMREAHFKAMSALGGMMAHELRTPLLAIALNARSIKNFFPILVQAYQEYSKISNIKKIRKGYLSSLEKTADEIEVSARYAGNTISTILSGFRYSASESFPLEEIEVNSIIQKALKDYPLTEKEKRLITFHSTGEYKATAAPNIMIHVLHNLLKNALYATQASNKGKITISVEKIKDGTIQIQFQDTAKGIPKETQEHIFEPFYTTKGTETSIGLGLYFCKMSLEKMDASITCESEEGEYSLFTIKLKGLPLKTE